LLGCGGRRTLPAVRTALLWFVAGLSVGCGPGNEELRAKLETRARFDLRCEQLQVVPLERTGKTITSYGVIGCGRQASYVLNASTQSWSLDASEAAAPPVAPGVLPGSTVGAPPPATAAPPPVAPAPLP
jgi:hypothetical protein